MLVYSGPIRVGKTTCVLFKAHYLCCQFPGARVLFLRQTQRSLAQSVLVTWESEVVPRSYLKPSTAGRHNRYSYEYKNGSEIVVGGMNNPDKYFSGQYDLICVFQAEECFEEPVMSVYTRLLHTVAPWRQMILDVNPRHESHWVKLMCERGDAVMVEGRLQDNPKYYDDAAREFTPAGRELLDSFERMPPHLRSRLKDGKWTNPEGARFADASKLLQGFHFQELFPQGIPSHWPRWLSIDYGKADPYCALWHTRDEDGVYYTYQEDYQTGFEADQQAERVRDLSLDAGAYEGLWMDGSMLADGEYARGFGWQPGKGSAAEQYSACLSSIRTEDGLERFGPLNAGARNVKEEAYVTLDSLLRQGRWKIALECPNLWNEIQGAVYYKDPRTGIRFEQVNPGNAKYCPDHALEAAGYGLHKRAPSPMKLKSADVSAAARAQAAQVKRRAAIDKSLRGKRRPSWL